MRGKFGREERTRNGMKVREERRMEREEITKKGEKRKDKSERMEGKNISGRSVV